MTEIRPFQPDDMFAVIRIAHESLTEQYNPSVFNYFYERFPKGFLVADFHHKIIGFIVCLPMSTESAKLLMLAVKKESRRKGVASMLFNAIEQIYMNQTIIRIELEVQTTNTNAIRFYEHQGFKITETLPCFYQNGESAYLMIKSW